MPQKRRWTDGELIVAVEGSGSYRQVIFKLNLIPAGGNYSHIVRKIKELELDTSHFYGKNWNRDGHFSFHLPETPTEQWLVKGSTVQSNTLKRRLFRDGLKHPKCELCGWAKTSEDGRIPVELDHINGDRLDNRLENLRILCPNCHSLQPTHRGKNKKVRYARVLERQTKLT